MLLNHSFEYIIIFNKIKVKNKKYIEIIKNNKIKVKNKI